MSMSDDMDLSARLNQAPIPEAPPMREFTVQTWDDNGILSNETVRAHSLTVQDGCLGLHVITYSHYYKQLTQTTVKVYNVGAWDRIDEVRDMNATATDMPPVMPAGSLLN